MPQPTKRLRSNPDLKYSIGRKRNVMFRGNQYKQAPSTDRVINARQRSAAESNNPRLKAASRRKILPLSDEQSQAGSAQFRLRCIGVIGADFLVLPLAYYKFLVRTHSAPAEARLRLANFEKYTSKRRTVQSTQLELDDQRRAIPHAATATAHLNYTDAVTTSWCRVHTRDRRGTNVCILKACAIRVESCSCAETESGERASALDLTDYVPPLCQPIYWRTHTTLTRTNALTFSSRFQIFLSFSQRDRKEEEEKKDCRESVCAPEYVSVPISIYHRSCRLGAAISLAYWWLPSRRQGGVPPAPGDYTQYYIMQRSRSSRCRSPSEMIRRDKKKTIISAIREYTSMRRAEHQLLACARAKRASSSGTDRDRRSGIRIRNEDSRITGVSQLSAHCCTYATTAQTTPGKKTCHRGRRRARAMRPQRSASLQLRRYVYKQQQRRDLCNIPYLFASRRPRARYILVNTRLQRRRRQQQQQQQQQASGFPCPIKYFFAGGFSKATKENAIRALVCVRMWRKSICNTHIERERIRVRVAAVAAVAVVAASAGARKSAINLVLALPMVLAILCTILHSLIKISTCAREAMQRVINVVKCAPGWPAARTMKFRESPPIDGQKLKKRKKTRKDSLSCAVHAARARETRRSLQSVQLLRETAPSGTIMRGSPCMLCTMWGGNDDLSVLIQDQMRWHARPSGKFEAYLSRVKEDKGHGRLERQKFVRDFEQDKEQVDGKDDCDMVVKARVFPSWDDGVPSSFRLTFATAYTPENVYAHLHCTGVLITIAHIATLVYTSSLVISPLLVHCTWPFMQAGPLILTARSADPARIPRRCTQRICIQDLPGISSLGRSSFSLSCLVYACGVRTGYLDNMRPCKHCVRMVGVAAAIIAAYAVRSLRTLWH
ncbi:unnamed protein product [Trichogramma brassicae]|uniref:Uncharacterized protein n=1 Tax=Trichogramma brassicae TaxID=86971 RepID=A0A6H5IA40_9HYME|nr:unnamed protein product [Trichogramma brassicae]